MNSLIGWLIFAVACAAPAWAQQYNPQLQPDWARAFEPPCVVSNEAGGAMRLLIDLYLETGDQKYLEPLPRVPPREPESAGDKPRRVACASRRSRLVQPSVNVA